jgi:malonate-semialdehyde dehydrogenase (acetylating)/methylmalonate-semialdehyde dehydrogenase
MTAWSAGFWQVDVYVLDYSSGVILEGEGEIMVASCTLPETETTDRYYFLSSDEKPDPISGVPAKRLKYCAGGVWKASETEKYMPCYDPSTGAVIAYAPQCTAKEVEETIEAAAKAYPAWRDTPVTKRVQVLFRMKHLLDEHLDELTYLCAQENGKKWDEAMGDVLKAIEVVEFACGTPQMMKGESLMNVSTGYDTVQFREPMGVFAGIAPWNFPAMIPQGWMAPICIATGNCMVLKAASFVPQSAMRIVELWKEAGLPDGVLNIVTAGRNEAEILLRHPAIKGVSFVGSTSVGQHIYATAASNGKRVQALTEAKNHALVMRDAVIERAAQGIMNSFCGCAGERCMALPVVVVENAIADELIEAVMRNAKAVKLGLAYDKSTGLGPVVNEGHKKYVLNWIETAIKEGAKLILDGRNPELPGECAKGSFVGPTIFDHVTEEMSCGREEIFGPVLCIKRVENFEEGLKVMNNSEFANGSVIYTENGQYAREFARRTDGGMVGINVGIPVPLGIFGFTGHKKSFFGDLHCMGRDGYIFYTETKNVTTTWFTGKKIPAKVSTWDGTMTRG